MRRVALAALLLVAVACAGTDKPRGFYGEVLAKRITTSPRDGEMVVVLTVGFYREPNSYEQDTREYPHLAPEARLRVGQCVLVQPFGHDMRITPCD